MKFFKKESAALDKQKPNAGKEAARAKGDTGKKRNALAERIVAFAFFGLSRVRCAG